VSGRRLRTLLQREARATLRDPFTMICLVAVPLAALLVFGFVLSTEVRSLSLGVYDASHSAVSRRFVSALAANDTFALHPYANREALDRAFVNGEVSAGIVVPPDFARGIAAEAAAAPAELVVIYDGAETVLAGNAEGFLRALVADTVGQVTARERDAQLAARRARLEPPPAHRGVDVRVRALFNPELDGTRFMVAGTFGFVLSFLTTVITAISIVKERLDGTFEQLQVTPATSFEILLGKIVPLGVVFTLDVVVMMLAGGFLLGVWPVGSALFFVTVSAFYVLTSLAIGIVISATSATAAEAVQKTVMLSIPLIQLSGFAFPLRSMPQPVQWLAELFPATHYIRVSHAIYLRGQGPLELLPELGILLAFAAALVLFAIRSMERRA
jgi:ABC-2 type transport system permease protein